MKFITYQPCPALRPYVRQLVVSEASEATTYNILPDTALVMGFQYKGKLATITNGTPQQLATAGITGLQLSSRTFINEHNTGTILVYFTETGAAAFFSDPVHELFAQSISLHHLFSRDAIEQVEEQLHTAATDRHRIQVVEAFLCAHLHTARQDALVLAAIAAIKNSSGNIRIATLGQQLYTSQSPLEKRFRSVVGTTPKKFAAIVRLQSVLNSKESTHDLTAIAYHHGYADQAHFIHDFRKMTGETPSAYFGKNK